LFNFNKETRISTTRHTLYGLGCPKVNILEEKEMITL